MELQLVTLGLIFLYGVGICAILVALCDIAKRLFLLDDVLALGAAVLALGVIGYLAFWLAFANFAAFRIGKVVVLAALLIHFGSIACRRRLSDYRWLAEPLLFTTLFFVAVVTLGYSNGGIGNPALTAQTRFSHPLPPDNIIPFIFALALQLKHVPSPLVGDWLASDRPPLQTGLYLLLNVRSNVLSYQIVASFLQATFLLGAWGLAVAAGLPVAARRLVLLACCLLPPTILNTFYTWPKMISVGYLLWVFALLFCYRPEDDRSRAVVGILLGGLCALAFLSHGTSAFALIGFAVVVVLAWQWPSLRTMAYGAVTLLLLYLPWIGYQAFIDPPGNRLLKYHLAGVVPVDARGFLAALRDSYGALSWDDYVRGRLENLWVMIGPWPGHLRSLAGLIVNPDTEAAKALRFSEFFHLLPSLQFFSLAALAALVLLPVMTGQGRERAVALKLAGATLLTCIVFAVLMFAPASAINHQGTYAVQVMTAVFALMVLALRAPALALLFIALQAGAVAALYVVTLPFDPAFWPNQALCIAAAAALAGYAVSPTVLPWLGRAAPLTR